MAEVAQHDDNFEEANKWDKFSDEQVRFGFIRKVYGILSVQLTITACFCLAAMYNPFIQSIVMSWPALIGVVICYIVSAVALMCCGLDRKVPVNYILCLIFTVCVSWIVATACVRAGEKNKLVVFEAAALTAATVIGLTIYAIRTKTDFTCCGSIFYTFGMIFLVTGVIAITFGPTLRLVYCMFGVMLFSFYLVIDTQMIVGGSNKQCHKIEEDSYILASVMLYLDIINMFLYILDMLR